MAEDLFYPEDGRQRSYETLMSVYQTVRHHTAMRAAYVARAELQS